MAEKSEQQRAMVRCLWLEYYNRTLLEKDAITRQQYFQMAQKIRRQYANSEASGHKGTA